MIIMTIFQAPHSRYTVRTWRGGIANHNTFSVRIAKYRISHSSFDILVMEPITVYILDFFPFYYRSIYLIYA